MPIKYTDPEQDPSDTAPKPTIHKTVVLRNGKQFAPGTEKALIAYGLTEQNYEYLTNKGALSNFEGQGVDAEDAEGTPPGTFGKPAALAAAPGALAPAAVVVANPAAGAITPETATPKAKARK